MGGKMTTDYTGPQPYTPEAVLVHHEEHNRWSVDRNSIFMIDYGQCVFMARAHTTYMIPQFHMDKEESFYILVDGYHATIVHDSWLPKIQEWLQQPMEESQKHGE